MGKVRLGDIITQISGVSYKPEDLSNILDDKSVVLLRANNIYNGSLIFDDVQYVRKEKVKNEQYLRAGDILICGSSGSKNLVGKAAYVSENMNVTFGTFCKVIRPSVQIKKYIGYFFQSQKYRNIISNAAIGANINNIKKEHIDNIQIPLCTEEKQAEIIKILDNIFAIKEKRELELKQLDLLIKARFVEMFGDPVKNPLNLKEDKLSNYLTVIGGYAFKSSDFFDSGIPILRIGNINTGHFTNNNLVYWKEDKDLERYKILPGDLVISLTGTVGKDDYANVCILGNKYGEYYLNQRNAKLEIFGELNNQYLSEVLSFSGIKKRLTGISRGIRQANISNKDILNLIIPIPSLNLQNQFSSFVQQIDKSKVAVQKSLDEAQLLYDSLMQKYFD